MGEMISLVHRQVSEKARETISRALKLIDFRYRNSFRTVVIKPNLCYYWRASTGYTTDPEVVSGIIDYIHEKYGRDIRIIVAEADASAMKTKYAFQILGYNKLAKKKNVMLFNLSNDVLEEREVEVGNCRIKFKIPQLLLESDFFINVPKLKVMRTTKITCAFKNIFGCIGEPRKIVYHPILSKAIVGINKILQPHLTIVDGLVALGRYPIKLNLIMASVDPFSVDWVASRVMGYNPNKVEFLKIAIKEKLGNPKDIVACGENIKDLSRIFPKMSFFSSELLWNIQFRLLNCYSKIVGDVIPPLLEKP